MEYDSMRRLENESMRTMDQKTNELKDECVTR